MGSSRFVEKMELIVIDEMSAGPRAYSRWYSSDS